MKLRIISLTALTLVIFACGGKEKNVENTTPNVPVIKNGLKIAFYVQDSLKNGFDYYREMDSTTKIKQTRFQNELEKKQKSLQEYVAKNEKLAQSGQLSAFDLQTAQQEAQRREQALYQYQQTEGVKIENETVEILEVLTKRIEAAGKEYCKKHKIDLLLIHGAGGQINFVNPSMDVTKEFIAYLNQHQEEIESTVSGKEKKKK
jgi:Skp family chaperone for outer membrane proteins